MHAYGAEFSPEPGFQFKSAKTRGASVLARDHLIESIGPAAELPATADEVIDARGHLVMPGLVNTHHHMYQSLTRAIPKVQEAELFSWLSGTRFGPASPEMVRVSTQLAMAELLLAGCTTSSDHLYIYPNGVRLDDIIEASREIGWSLDFRSWADHRLGEGRPDAWAPRALP